MQNNEKTSEGTSGSERPLRNTVDFNKIRARWREFCAKYPALDRSLSVIRNIRWHGILATLRNRLIAGVLIAIPIIVTVWVLQIAFNFISTVSLPWLKAVNIQAPQWVAFAVTLLALLGLGFMATNVIGAQIIEGTEKLLLKIPGVAPIFSATKQIIEAFKGMSGPTSFQRVVYVDYPSPGCRLLGFVTGQFFDPTIGKEVTTVFLPTCPNPITGFVLVVDSERVDDAPLALDEATKMLVSVGLVTPKDRMARMTAAEALLRVSSAPAAKETAPTVSVSTIEIIEGKAPRLTATAAPQAGPTVPNNAPKREGGTAQADESNS